MSNQYFKDLGFTVTCDYGWRKIVKSGVQVKEFHPGVDLVAPKPQDHIRAFVAGKVIFSGEAKAGSGYGGFGNAVAIEDKYGCVHVYGHLSECLAKVNDTVKKGQIIGVEGNSGISVGTAHRGYLAGEHLHYEIRKEKEYVADREKRCYVPEEYLKQYFEKDIESIIARHPKLKGRTYTTQKADVVADLIRAYGLTLEELQALNPKVNFGKLVSGMKIRLG